MAEGAWQVDGEELTGCSTVTMRARARVDQDQVRQLPTGEADLIVRALDRGPGPNRPPGYQVRPQRLKLRAGQTAGRLLRSLTRRRRPRSGGTARQGQAVRTARETTASAARGTGREGVRRSSSPDGSGVGSVVGTLGRRRPARRPSSSSGQVSRAGRNPRDGHTVETMRRTSLGGRHDPVSAPASAHTLRGPARRSELRDEGRELACKGSRSRRIWLSLLVLGYAAGPVPRVGAIRPPSSVASSGGPPPAARPTGCPGRPRPATGR
jgi:hypothetical protein